MKKTIILPILCLLLSLCACGTGEPAALAPTEEPVQTQTAPAVPDAVQPPPDGEELPDEGEAAPEAPPAEPESRHYEPIPPRGHFHAWWEDETRRQESSCSENGTAFLICAACGREESRELPRKQHSFYWECNNYGHRCMCSVCGEPYSPDTYIFYPHNYVLYGNNTRMCSVCGWVWQYGG